MGTTSGTTSSSASGTISNNGSSSLVQFWGLGSNISNINDVITSLLYADNNKVKKLQDDKSDLELKTSDLNSLSSGIKSLQDYCDYFSKTTFNPKTSSVSDNSCVTVTPNKNATSMDYSLSISQIAKPNIVESNKIMDINKSLNKSGSFSINGTTITITDTDSLSSIMNKINNPVDKDGKNIPNPTFKSYIIDGKLLIENKNMGDGVNINFTDSSDILKSLGIINSDNSLNSVQKGQSAKFSLNGINIVKDSNDITDVIPNVELKLTKETSSPVSVSVSDNISEVKANIKNFIAEINNIFSAISSLTAYDAEKKKASLFTGDDTLAQIKDTLVKLLESKSNNSGSINYCFQAGISIDKSGNFGVDDATLEKALKNNFDDTISFFNNNITKVTDSTINVNDGKYDLKQKNVVYNSEVITNKGNKLTRIDTGNFTGPNQYKIDYSTGIITPSSDISGSISTSFSYISNTGESTGVFAKLNKLIKDITGTDGLIQSRLASYTDMEKDYDNQISTENDYISSKKDMLTKQFTQMESIINSLKSQGNYITNMFSNNSN